MRCKSFHIIYMLYLIINNTYMASRAFSTAKIYQAWWILEILSQQSSEDFTATTPSTPSASRAGINTLSSDFRGLSPPHRTDIWQTVLAPSRTATSTVFASKPPHFGRDEQDITKNDIAVLISRRRQRIIDDVNIALSMSYWIWSYCRY